MKVRSPKLLQDSLKEPMYYEDAFTTEYNGEICLTNQGKKAFKDIKSKFSADKKFTHLLHSLRLIRDIYEKLTKEELLFLIYVTYPEYVEFSNIYDRLVKNQEKKEQISKNLLKKGLITEERYKELLSLVAE